MALAFIVSPAKKMNVVEGPPSADAAPECLERSRTLLRTLEALGYDELKRLWGCSDRLAQMNFERLQDADLDRNLTAACIAYEGIQYTQLAPQVMDEAGLAYLGSHLRILSGFYGVLRPFDGVIPYRLEMQAKLAVPSDGRRPQTSTLYDFWGDELARILARDFDLVVNVASVEYAKAVTPQLERLGTPVVSCLFGSVRDTDGKFVQRSTEAKATRGSFVRWCAERGVEEVGQLRSFAERGYRFDPTRSSEARYVFTLTDR